jgi:arsenate reductase
MDMENRKALKVYYYPKCGSCRNALKFLQAKGHALDLQNLYEQPPTEAEIREWLRVSGLGPRAFFNTSGEVYRELNLKEKLPGMSEDEQIRLLASNGRLVKRPVVTDGRKLTVGWKEDAFEANWG